MASKSRAPTDTALALQSAGRFREVVIILRRISGTCRSEPETVGGTGLSYHRGRIRPAHTGIARYRRRWTHTRTGGAGGNIKYAGSGTRTGCSERNRQVAVGVHQRQ